MLDFTNSLITKKTYDGANGNKLSIIFNNDLYMLKFPSIPGINKEMSYSNSCFSEYLGSHIFHSIGIPVHETLLGTYQFHGKVKIAVACKDFTTDETVFQDFASLKNIMIDSGHNGYGTELTEIEETIFEQSFIDPIELNNRFWDMFVVDAFIGNWDRHNGNWGFIYNKKTDSLSLAPVFDCGSSLYPQADETIMKKVLDNPDELNYRIFEIPLSAIRINGQKIRYFDFMSSLQNKNCNTALQRILPRIDMAKIQAIITDMPYISNLQKDFYCTILEARKQRILDKCMQKLYSKKHSLSFER